ncbi:hypothetical protein N658DRAFT_57412 [Parathielavia hyrcaniae]|uniref:Uncharacterized protein n=1 Tax=Parathielavia hyrcaniae TaxID=113614 RepID=A0AAN6T277_9PEZI|nr:hypothetical protein N658DRAFT_57412 [Parathielavia hyrcaniae]
MNAALLLAAERKSLINLLVSKFFACCDSKLVAVYVGPLGRSVSSPWFTATVGWTGRSCCSTWSCPWSVFLPSVPGLPWLLTLVCEVATASCCLLYYCARLDPSRDSH